MAGARRDRVRWIGLVAGPVAALVMYALLPERYAAATGEMVSFTPAGRATTAILVWMGVWWLTEALDIAATALIPLAAFPLLGVAGMKAAAAPYADPLIFLFMGGFLLALSMQRWGLDRRIALLVLRAVGGRPPRMVAGLMIATAVLSAFVSNTATTAMMLPIGLSLIRLVCKETDMPAPGSPHRAFAVCVMLSIAYASSIGGIATIIGTPPNAFLVGFLKDKIAADYRVELGFVEWLAIGVPVVAVYLPFSWWLLTRRLFHLDREEIAGAKELIAGEYARLGRTKPAEWAVLAVFLAAAVAWIVRPILAGGIDGVLSAPLPGLSDTGIAMIAALVLFVVPARRDGARTALLDWETAAKLPFGILILFGGGLSLAAAVEQNGVAQFLGAQAAGLRGVPVAVVIVVVTASVIFLTELTSNTATAAALVPLLAALAPALGVHPYMLVFPATIAASCAFMLPVGTPPNAIVFGSGCVDISEMSRAGVWLNLAGVVIISALSYAFLVLR